MGATVLQRSPSKSQFPLVLFSLGSFRSCLAVASDLGCTVRSAASMIREQINNWRATSPAPSRLIDPRLFVLALFLLSATVALFGTRVSTTAVAAQAAAQTAAAQQPRRTPARRRRAATPRLPAIDYTKFSHATK